MVEQASNILSVNKVLVADNAVYDHFLAENMAPLIADIADGYSRLHNGRKIGLFTMQRGPGAENAFGGVAQAYADSVPLLLLPGGEAFHRLGVHHEVDHQLHLRKHAHEALQLD